jgi:hypothetical protein
MTYKGITYSYAFTFKIPVDNGADREFNIAISNYREDSQDFSGLCLENELRVISEERMLFAAFFDIVNRITTITIGNEKEFSKLHSDIIPNPLMSVMNSDFYKKFEDCKKSKRSLEYYERLRIWFENKDSFPDRKFTFPENNIISPKEPEIFICNTIVNFNILAQKERLQIKDAGFFTL